MNFPFPDRAKIRLSILPGESKYGELVLENPTPQPRTMRAYLEDWYYIPPGDGSKEFRPANATPLSCASWILFSPAEFAIPPFGKQKVNYSIKVPLQAKGGYYAAIFFEGTLGQQISQKQQELGVGIDLALRIASLFYVEAEGTIKRTAQISKLALNKESISGPLFISMELSNTGNVDITAAAAFYIMDKQGMVVARGEFNNGYTFPGDKVKLATSWKEPLPRGKYDLVLSINIGKAQEEAGIGRGEVVTKETEIEVDADGKVIKVGQLK